MLQHTRTTEDEYKDEDFHRYDVCILAMICVHVVCNLECIAKPNMYYFLFHAI